MTLSAISSLVVLASALLTAAQTYTVLNNCPAPIDLYIGEWFETKLATGAQVVKTGLGPTPGHFWTPTNNGIRDGGNVAGAAGFRMNVSLPLTICSKRSRCFIVAQRMVLLYRQGHQSQRTQYRN